LNWRDVSGTVDGMRHAKRPIITTERARVLRKNMTPEERRLWWYLRDRFELRWRRQEPVGPFIADFVCYSPRVVVEADGGQHVMSDWDRARDASIRSRGFEILRFDNADINQHIEEVLSMIADVVLDRTAGGGFDEPAVGSGPDR
jgi:very-short-patch-repair endonuclease